MEWSGAIGSGAEDNGPKHLVAERRIMERSEAEYNGMEQGGAFGRGAEDNKVERRVWELSGG